MAENNITQINNIEISHIMSDLESKQWESNILVYDSATDEKWSAHNRPFRSEHFSVLLVKKGTFRLKVNLFEHRMQENSLIVIAPSFIRQIIFEDGVEFYALLFKQEYLFKQGFYQKHFRLFPPFDEDFQAHLDLDSKNTDFLTQLLELLKKSLNLEQRPIETYNVTGLLFQAIMLRLGECYKISLHKPATVSENDLTYRFLSLLTKHFKEHRVVNFYAEKLFVNPKYLTQVLSKNYGKSTREYIVEIVIMEAKTLLDMPQISIKKIADELHFANQFHFSRFFKKYTGFTPSEYRSHKI